MITAEIFRTSSDFINPKCPVPGTYKKIVTIPNGFKKVKWYFDFEDMGDILFFIEKNGPVVMSKENGQIIIEIYDDYRE